LVRSRPHYRVRQPLTYATSLVYRVAVSSKPIEVSRDNRPNELVIDRNNDVLTFTLNNVEHGNEVTGAMFDAMLAELRAEASRPSARVLRIRARGKVFCTGRERAGRDVIAIRSESARLIEFKRALRISPLISVAEVQGDAFGFGFGLAIVCDFVYVADSASLGFPEMRFGLAPAAIMAYLGEYALPRFAFPLVLFGDPIVPQHALQIGLISKVCLAGCLTTDADALVQRILKLEPNAARSCKEFFQTAQQNSFDQNCRLAVEALTVGSMAVLAKEK
jgi:methylglutaconyl-CoA hydratase